jgi:Putative transposase
MIVPGGGVSLDGSRWISSAEDYLLPVPVLSRMFRGKMLAMLKTAHNTGRLQFFGPHADLADKAALKAFLEPLYHMPSARSPGPSRCWPISLATPTALPFPRAD